MNGYLRFKIVYTRVGVEITDDCWFDKTDFDSVCNRCNITGIGFDDLVDIFAGRLPDQPINIGGSCYDGNNVPIYAREFFMEWIYTMKVEELDVLDENVESFDFIEDHRWDYSDMRV